MSYLPIVEDEQATGKLREVYDAVKNKLKLRQAPPILQAFSPKPDLLDQMVKLYGLVGSGGSSLGRRWEEMLATAVSTWNRCHY